MRFKEQAAHPTGAVGKLMGRLMRIFNRASNIEVAELAESLHPARVCEIGCGPGQLLAMLAERLPQADITGIDVSGEMVDMALRETRKFGDRVRVQELSVEGVLDEREPYDLMLAVHSFQFWRQPEILVPKLRRVLSEGGHVLLCLRLRQRRRDSDLVNAVSTEDDQASAISDLFVRSGFCLERNIGDKILLFGAAPQDVSAEFRPG